MSRHTIDRRVATALCLIVSSVTGASAQQAHRGGASAVAVPHAAAPAPHVAAPAPHVAAPPAHVAAPAPHVAAPHLSQAPRVSPHVPQAPHFAGTTARPHFAARHPVEPHPQRYAAPVREPGRHALPESGRHATVTSRTGPAGERLQEHPTGAGETVGLSHQNRETLQTERARTEHNRLAPIVRNPVFASGSPRTIGTSLSRWTFRGRFAQSAFARDYRQHRHVGIVLGFVGLAFWPYAYDDFYDYVFAPYAYDTFWPYAFDDVYAGIYGGYAPEYYAPEDAYAYAGSPASARTYARTEGGNTAGFGGNSRICSGQAKGVTDFSIQKITDQVQPDAKQRALLDALKAATVKAVDILQAACPADLPSTATGRLAVMRTRVDAMLKAVQTVRPALGKFYESLNDEQRSRFNALDQGEQARTGNLDRLCRGQDSTPSRLPIDRIQRSLHLSRGQDDTLKALDGATAKAAEILKAQCQPQETLTPTGRLTAMQDRLAAMSQALKTTQSALTDFYGSLNDEQKAQFDRINARSG